MARSDPVVRSCPACRVEVSVPGHFVDPRCPTCGGALGAISESDLDETGETLREVRTDSGVEDPAEFETLRDHKRPEDYAAQPVVEETATFAGQTVGERMGPYELIRILGKGGMGVVYEARHTELGRRVALKVMRASDAGQEELERFKREARAAAKLRHPNIVPILEVGDHEGQHYFTMTLVEGQTLTALARSGSLEPAEAARLIAAVARAIHYAHEQGVIHRDLKPSNVLVDPEGTPYVMDFGLAKDLSDVSGLTLTGIAMGSPPYMPPEQARGEFRQVDAVSDVYGLGATLYECLVGRPPFGGKSLYDVIAKVLAEDPPSPRGLKPELPYDLETVCLKALEKEKWRRYPSALDLARDLDRFLQGQSIRAVRQGLTTRVGRVIARHRLQIFSMLIPIAVATALAAYVFGAAPPPPDEIRPRRELTKRDAEPGDLARAAEYLATARGHQALAALLASYPRLPQADVCALALSPLSDRSPGLLEAREALEQTAGPATPELLARAGLALVEAQGGRRQDVSLDELSQVARAWFSEGSQADLFRRTLLALRGARSGARDAWQAALSGPAGPLDGAIAGLLERSLQTGETVEAAVRDLPRPATSSVKLRYEPPRTEERGGFVPGRLTARRGSEVLWTFPPYRLGDGDPAPLERAISGLIRPHERHDPSPTAGALSPDGARVAVGWLRFAYLLDAQSGAVLARRRLPGLAQRIDLAPEGGFRLDVWLDPELILRGCSLSADLGELRDPEGHPFPPSAFLAPGSLLPDQAWREACAEAPQLDSRLEVRLVGGPTPSWRLLDLQGRGREWLDLRFRQPLWTPTVLHAAATARPEQLRIESAVGSEQWVRVLTDADLLALRPVDRIGERGVTSIRPGLRLTLKTAAGPRRTYHYTPFDEPSPSQWAGLASALGERQSREAQAPNPWTLAFLAAARARAAQAGQGEARDLERLTEAAATSPDLDPHGRVALACFLDRHGFERAADQAIEQALAEVWACGFLPEWAGYGPLDCGRLLADRVEECLVESPRRPARATTLARWRDAFAPNLRDSRLARVGYRWRGGDFEPAPAAARPPPDLPETIARQPAPKGLAHMDLTTLVRVDHALRLKAWFFVVLGALLATSLLRYGRHARRDLARIGKADGWARFTMWFQRPAARARFSWPTYLTLNDKLAFVALYLAFFAVFAVAEASLEILVAVRGAPQALLAGLPHERHAERFLGLAAERDEHGVYAAAYLRVSRGQALGRLDGPLALLGQREPRALLLWAEAAPRELAERAQALEALSGRLEPSELLRLELLRARDRADAAEIERLERALATQDLSFAGWRWAKARAAAQPGSPAPLGLPVAPAPTARDRDAILAGSTHWASQLPRVWLLNMLAQPPPEDRKVQLDALGQNYDWGVSLARFHNALFFLVPTTLVLLVASLFMPAMHAFEPLASDLAPTLQVRLFRILVPGVTQHQRNRPLRGVFLLVGFAYLVTAVLDHYFEGGAFAFAGSANSLTSHLSSLEVAHFTGEVASAVGVVRTTHGVELLVCLIAVYFLHWIDLWRSQRKVYATEERPDSAAPRYVVPVDSASQSLFASEPPATSPDPARRPSLFDRTEAGPGSLGSATAQDRLDLPPHPLERTELDLARRVERTERIELDRTERALGLPPRPGEDFDDIGAGSDDEFDDIGAGPDDEFDDIGAAPDDDPFDDLGPAR